MIPALHDAEFLRYGVMHRNTFLNSPRCWTGITAEKRAAPPSPADDRRGGYVDPRPGFLVAWRRPGACGACPGDFPQETAIGALGLYVSDTSVTAFQPMNINFGIIPPWITGQGQAQQERELSQRSWPSSSR
jgi:methylenetetrahydrofolate--tRNA-(uracil-5-)-methyltransferase